MTRASLRDVVWPRRSERTPICEGTSSPCHSSRDRAWRCLGLKPDPACAAHRATDWHPQEREPADVEAAPGIECCDETG